MCNLFPITKANILTLTDIDTIYTSVLMSHTMAPINIKPEFQISKRKKK